MNIMYQSASLVTQQGTKKVELIARNCYKSLDKIKSNSDIPFCKNLIASGHTAPFMHSWVYFDVTNISRDLIKDVLILNKYVLYDDNVGVLAFNYRVLIDMCYKLERYKHLYSLVDAHEVACLFMAMYCHVEELIPIFGDYKSSLRMNDSVEILARNLYRIDEEYVKDNYPHLYVQTLFITTDRGVTHEIVRHTEMSFMQESTRYCNYAKGKFGESINVIEPKGFDTTDVSNEQAEWCDAIADAEAHYKTLVNDYNWTPQDARSVLPTATKADIFVTAPLYAWKGENVTGTLALTTIHESKGFLAQRYSSKAHPMMRELAIKIGIALNQVNHKYINF